MDAVRGRLGHYQSSQTMANVGEFERNFAIHRHPLSSTASQSTSKSTATKSRKTDMQPAKAPTRIFTDSQSRYLVTQRRLMDDQFKPGKSTEHIWRGICQRVNRMVDPPSSVSVLQIKQRYKDLQKRYRIERRKKGKQQSLWPYFECFDDPEQLQEPIQEPAIVYQDTQFTEEQSMFIITARLAMENVFSSSRFKEQLWRNICADMKIHFPAMTKESHQVAKRFEKLRARYNEELRKFNRTNTTPSWRYFSAFHDHYMPFAHLDSPSDNSEEGATGEGDD